MASSPLQARQTRALIARPPKQDGTINLTLETVHYRKVAPDELLIKVVATGICHSDVYYAGQPASQGGIYPRVLGHEGAGYVIEAGSDITIAGPGDAVLMAYPSCGTCRRCRNGNPCFCTTITNEHLKGEAGIFQSQDRDESGTQGQGIHGQFHGQSSFANYTIVKEGAVTNAKELVDSEMELKLFASLVCGFQTGAGSVLSVANARSVDSVVVIGLGGVGLGAVIAAKTKGCSPIIGVDLHQTRLDAATKLGATRVLKSGADNFDLVKEIKDATAGCGASIVLDTTGLVKIIEAGIEAVQDGGKFVHVGMPNPIDAELKISLIKFLGVRDRQKFCKLSVLTHWQTGKSFMSSKAGDIQPREVGFRCPFSCVVC